MPLSWASSGSIPDWSRALERATLTRAQAWRWEYFLWVIRYPTPTRLAWGSPFFSRQFLQGIHIQGLLDHDLLQPAVLSFQLP
jgi:hypothetical protein